MTSNNRYSHIKSFKDFEHEKINLHYQIKLSEKKLEIKKLELKYYVNPIKFFSSFFNELARPMMKLTKSIIMHFVEKNKDKEEKNSSNSEKKHKNK